MHPGDEAAVEFRTFLARAHVTARVQPVPELGVIRQERQLRAIAGLGEFFPSGNLCESILFVKTLERGLSLRPINFLPAEKIAASLHHGNF
jgi:hypothetical protein